MQGGEQGRLVLSNDQGVQWSAQATPGGGHSQAKPWWQERVSHAAALEDHRGRSRSGAAEAGLGCLGRRKLPLRHRNGSHRRPLSRVDITLWEV